jgi:hypothetical protein
VDSDRSVDQNPTIGTSAIPAAGVDGGALASPDGVAVCVAGPTDGDLVGLAAAEEAAVSAEPDGEASGARATVDSPTATVARPATATTIHRLVPGLIERPNLVSRGQRPMMSSVPLAVILSLS